MSLCDGIIRARYRESLSEPRAILPGEPTRYSIELASTAHRFAAGHRLRLKVSSSNFPRFAPNPNTGGPMASEAEAHPAVQHVLHDSDHPSELTIWVLPA